MVNELTTIKSYNPEDYIFVSNGAAKYWLGPVSDIVSLEVSGNYTEFLISNGQKLMVHGPLGKWEAKLPSIFFRTGRDCIVNLSQVKSMRAFDSKRFALVIVGDKEVVMSRQQSILFRKLKSL